jgi:hypothetical protein
MRRIGQMKTFWQTLDEKQDECKTLYDWRRACAQLYNSAREYEDSVKAAAFTLDELYGDEAERIVCRAKSLHEMPDFPDDVLLWQYGYTKRKDVLVLNKEDASILFSLGIEVLAFSPDNTDKKITSAEEIASWDGYLGITYEEADRLQEMNKEG